MFDEILDSGETTTAAAAEAITVLKIFFILCPHYAHSRAFVYIQLHFKVYGNNNIMYSSRIERRMT